MPKIALRLELAPKCGQLAISGLFPCPNLWTSLDKCFYNSQSRNHSNKQIGSVCYVFGAKCFQRCPRWEVVDRRSNYMLLFIVYIKLVISLHLKSDGDHFAFHPPSKETGLSDVCRGCLECPRLPWKLWLWFQRLLFVCNFGQVILARLSFWQDIRPPPSSHFT